MPLSLLSLDFSGICVGFVISNVFGLKDFSPKALLFRPILNNYLLMPEAS
jgi:hypothetical protein